MPETVPDCAAPEHELLAEMRYALRLAEEREKSADEELGRLDLMFASRIAELAERAELAEKNAERAEIRAAEAEARMSKALEGLRLLRCRLDAETRG
jgi:hypothetical protein